MEPRPSRPWLAALLSALCPGLGHLYCSKPKVAILITYLLNSVLLLLLALSPRSPLLLLLCLLLGILIYIGSIPSAFFAARGLNQLESHRYNRWYYYLVYIFVFGVLFNQAHAWVSSSMAKAFKTPSASMLPTIEPGDKIIADMHFFRSSLPQRGQIVIFSQLDNPLTEVNEAEIRIIKRIVAISGDTVEIKDGQLFVNSNLQTGEYTAHTSKGSPSENTEPLLVPPNTVYVLGDNRAASKDSRHYTNPFVANSRLMGLAKYIYWPSGKISRLGKDI